ncbi:hypothetical protein TPHA_0J01260 [Tetrapisispora phaffii CBS 4417]|uniref:Phospholipid/glycerol acyltransferase domain-containing protein n=1 Tax=Tetrapisispora phaffii (strain ATCC 24235 / CBS 4417 / NBRC 1672 / NRRL Y-8282 / UCD 70-5) TaxID=1071381 RepID=G8BYK6_TETPH|nr:hypothetical protein TPHA_0J01260 [Tetrapisispora phaffii CBS 4417]CCE64948.1 hypothetical protein TPHA_0J01260 [Tetrapisispora phaffii CBS 4417]
MEETKTNTKSNKVEKTQSSPHIPKNNDSYFNHYNGYVYNFKTWIYDMFILLLSILFKIFFREIKIRGGHNVPPIGTPTILVCAPHANQFIDPSLVMVATRTMLSSEESLDPNRSRQTCFVTAASSFKLPVVAQFGIATGGIPVPRAQDNLKDVDPSLIIYAPDLKNSPNLIKGKVADPLVDKVSLNFTTRFEPKGLLGLPNYLANAKIEKIIDDDTILLASPFRNIDSKIQKKIDNYLINGTTFRYAQKIDNSKVFQNVFNHLHTRGCVGIFPEGGSHDRPSLLPLKAGIAIMALGAVAASPDLKVSIVPVGLNYFHRNKFRSRAVIEYGEPIVVDNTMGEEYIKDSRGSVSNLLKKISNSLYAVTENAPDYETLMVIQAARRLYKPALHNKRLPLTVVCKINRNLLLGYSKFKDDERIVNLKKAVLNYNKKLHSFGIKDHQVEQLKIGWINTARTLAIFVKRVLFLTFYFILSLPGSILFTPIFVTAHYYSKRKQVQGLKKSVVKIKGLDLIATWKIIVALGMAPILYITYSLILVSLCNSIKFNGLVNWMYIPFNNKFLQFGYFYLILVLISYSSLKTGEVGMDVFKSLPPLFVTLFYPSKNIKEIKLQRSKLSTEITNICNELGPEVISDFDKYKTVNTDSEKESSSQSPSLYGHSRSSSINSLFSNALSRVNSRGSLTDIPILGDGMTQSMRLEYINKAYKSDAVGSETEPESEPESKNGIPSKIADLVREKRQNNEQG